MIGIRGEEIGMVIPRKYISDTNLFDFSFLVAPCVQAELSPM